jgi:hypothetical protein
LPAVRIPLKLPNVGVGRPAVCGYMGLVMTKVTQLANLQTNAVLAAVGAFVRALHEFPHKYLAIANSPPTVEKTGGTRRRSLGLSPPVALPSDPNQCSIDPIIRGMEFIVSSLSLNWRDGTWHGAKLRAWRDKGKPPSSTFAAQPSPAAALAIAGSFTSSHSRTAECWRS